MCDKLLLIFNDLRMRKAGFRIKVRESAILFFALFGGFVHFSFGFDQLPIRRIGARRSVDLVAANLFGAVGFNLTADFGIYAASQKQNCAKSAFHFHKVKSCGGSNKKTLDSD